mmetsp:Transcript_14608/g.31830  ORF Transcript_14608/g.31830 Transcript_14608/m.31830 type:complete len:204 (+) Transcript_14608:34-645(+)
MKHNNVIPNVHFHKDWQNRVKTWFKQAPKKQSRRRTRAVKAARIFPRPVAGLLRPIVRGQTIRYNSKQRLGRGFTLAELKDAGLTAQKAQTIGIAVDYRRKNRSEESVKINSQRLKEYTSKLIVFPRNKKNPKAGDATKEQMAAAVQETGQAVMPIKRAGSKAHSRAITEADKKSAFQTLRLAWSSARLDGIKQKKNKEKEEK